MLVSFDQRTIEVHTRATGWTRTAETEPVHRLFDDVIEVGCHGLRLGAADVFAGL